MIEVVENGPEPPRQVRVRALKAFDLWAVGDTFQAVMNDRLANLIVNHYLEEIPWPRSE